MILVREEFNFRDCFGEFQKPYNVLVTKPIDLNTEGSLLKKTFGEMGLSLNSQSYILRK